MWFAVATLLLPLMYTPSPTMVLFVPDAITFPQPTIELLVPTSFAMAGKTVPAMVLVQSLEIERRM